MKDDRRADDVQDDDVRSLLAMLRDSQQRLESRLDELSADRSGLVFMSASRRGIAFRLLKTFVWCAGVVFTVMIAGCVVVGGVAVIGSLF